MNFKPAKDIQDRLYQLLKEKYPMLDLEEIDVVHPSFEQFGDYSSNIAMLVSDKDKDAKALDIAKYISEKYQPDEVVENVQVAGNGFVNFKLRSEYYLLINKKHNRIRCRYLS